MRKIQFFIAWRYLKGKGSALLSMNARLSFIGVFTGATLLVIVLSIFNGFQRQLKMSIFEFDPHIRLSKDSMDAVAIKDWKIWKKKLYDELSSEVETIEGIIQSPAILRRKSTIEHVFLRAVELPLQNNSYYTFPEHFPKIVEPQGMNALPKGNSCLIGAEMAVNLGLRVGDTIELVVPRGQFSLQLGVTPSLRPFTVAGFFKTGHYQYDSRVVLLALDQAQNLFAIGDSVQQLAVRVKDTNRLREVRQKFLVHWPYSVRTLEEEQRNFFAALRLEKTIMTTIVFLFIISAMVGIIVATYNVVRSHRRDIGILKALGMSDTGILLIFTMTGFIMGSLGAVTGILTGIFVSLKLESIIGFLESSINTIGAWYAQTFQEGGIWFKVQLIPRDVYYFDHLPIHIDPAFLHTVAAVAILLSGMASLIPAWKASQMEPVKIIRGGGD